MKRFAGALLLVTFTGVAIACPDEAKDAQAATGFLSSKLAKSQPQMSRAPATAAAKSGAATANVSKAVTATRAAAETTKKSPSGG